MVGGSDYCYDVYEHFDNLIAQTRGVRYQWTMLPRTQTGKTCLQANAHQNPYGVDFHFDLLNNCTFMTLIASDAMMLPLINHRLSGIYPAYTAPRRQLATSPAEARIFPMISARDAIGHRRTARKAARECLTTPAAEHAPWNNR